MVDIKEIRIGNYIGAVSLDNITEVDFINAVDGIIGSTNFADRGPEDFVGIPLTEEWLLKVGFVRDSDLFYKKHGCQFLLDVFPCENTYEVCFSIVRENKIGTILRYVHQLQNLYFALTGQELQLKIDSLNTR